MDSPSQSQEVNQTISLKFLANALGEELEIIDFEITSGTKPGDNFMSVIYSAEVNCKTKSGEELTKYLLLKCYPVHPSRQEFTNKSNMFFKELEIYRLWIPELRRFQTEVIGLKEAIKLPYAPFVYGKCIDFDSAGKDEYTGKVLDPLDNYIIMEDLRKAGGFRMTNRRDSMDIDHIKLVMIEMAKIHALSWAYKSYVEPDVCTKYPCLTGGVSADDKPLWMVLLNNNIQQAVEILDSVLGAGNKLTRAINGFKGIIGTVMDVIFGVESETVLDSLLRLKPELKFGQDSTNPEPWRIIAHGDCWSNNLLFQYDPETKKPFQVVLVDLQMVRETCVAADLSYAIYVCTDAEFRKKHMNEILKLYFDSFNGFCETLKTETLPGFTLESFKYRFHRFKLVGLLNAMFLLPIALKEDEIAVAMNMEEMGHDKNISDMFSDVCQSSGVNKAFNDRLIGLLQELYDDGVI